MPVRLVFIAGEGTRDIPGMAYVPKQVKSLTVVAGENLEPQKIRFADAAPYLVTTTSSEMDALSRLPPESRDKDVILRFRPNIHIDVGGAAAPYEEDDWLELTVSSERNAAKAIVRCVFKTPRCLSLNVDSSSGTIFPRNQQLYGLLAKDRRVSNTFPRMQTQITAFDETH